MVFCRLTISPVTYRPRVRERVKRRVKRERAGWFSNTSSTSSLLRSERTIRQAGRQISVVSDCGMWLMLLRHCRLALSVDHSPTSF